MAERDKQDKSNDEDDEISIDFSKLGSIFKKGKKKKEKQQPVKKKRKPQPENESPEEDDAALQEENGWPDDEIDAVGSNQAKEDDEARDETADEAEDEEQAETKAEAKSRPAKVKSGKKHHHKEKHSSDENPDESLSLSFDTASVKKFISTKTFVTISLIILLLIPLIVSVAIRSYPVNLPVTDDMARNGIYANVKESIRMQVLQQYPTLSRADVDKEVNELFSQFLKEQGQTIEEQVKLQGQYYRDRFQDENGLTYLLSIDPYHYYQRSMNIIENGHIGEILKDGKPFSTYMVAPIGRFVDANLHDYMSVYIYRIMQFFDKNAPFVLAMFWLPVIFSALAVIPAFFIARRISGNFAGFIAGLIIAVHPAFLGRTVAGAPDTDPYAVFFPLLIIWLFFEAFYCKHLWKKLLLSAAAGFTVGVFAFTWSGWWYVFDFIIVMIIGYIVYEIVKAIVQKKNALQFLKGKDFTTELSIMGVFLVSSLIFVSLLEGFMPFINGLTSPLSFMSIQSAIHSTVDLWPNVYTTVAELNPAGISTVIQQIGGGLFFVFASIGIILTLFPKKITTKQILVYCLIPAVWFAIFTSSNFRGIGIIKFLALFAVPIALALYFTLRLKQSDEEKKEIKYTILFAVWFMGTIFASLKGVRFVMILVPAFAICLGVFFGKLTDLLSELISKGVKISATLSKVFIVILVLILLGALPSFADKTSCPFWPQSGIMCSGVSTARGEVPLIDDAWYDVLTYVKVNSTQDAIVNSWWDFGHWFKAIADRRVTFDGASQNTPMAHWMGRALLSDSENESVAILRMLVCGSNEAYNLVNKRLNDSLSSVKFVKGIILLDENDARQALLDAGFTGQEANDVLARTHCQPPQDIFITSGDMVGKSGVWAHFGSWNFDRAFQHNLVDGASYDTAIAELKTRFGMSDEQATQRYYEIKGLLTDRDSNNWIAPWPSYLTGSTRPCYAAANSTNITCSYGIGVGSSNNNQYVLESATIDLAAPENSSIIFGVYDATTGAKLGATSGKPGYIGVTGEDGIEVYPVAGSNFEYGFLLIQKSPGSYESLVMDAALLNSTFTKLFYLDGKYTSHFSKLTQKTTVGGDKIIVWDVVW